MPKFALIFKTRAPRTRFDLPSLMAVYLFCGVEQPGSSLGS
jgi:hypothetical protein